MFDIQGKVAIVTGGASGIGLATVESLLKKGAKVVMADIDLIKLHEESTRLCVEYFDDITYCVADVSNVKQVEELVKFAVDTYGRLDIMVANAGIDIAAPHSSEHLAEAQKIIDINLMGAYYCNLFAIEQMVKQGNGGSVVNTSSVASYRGLIGHVMYSASKHGLIGMTKALANEYRKENIRVSAVAPGGVETPLTGIGHLPEEVKQQIREGIKEFQPRGFASAEDIAHAIIFAIENEQATACNLIIDGGMGELTRMTGQ